MLPAVRDDNPGELSVGFEVNLETVLSVPATEINVLEDLPFGAVKREFPISPVLAVVVLHRVTLGLRILCEATLG